MPRILTIVGAQATQIPQLVAAAMARYRGLTISPAEDESEVSLFIESHPGRSALTVVQPSTVNDRREITRLLRIDIPQDWKTAVLTQCIIPWEADFDPSIQVVQDLAIMSGSLLVREGALVPEPQDWPWHQDEDGDWIPDPRLLVALGYSTEN